LILLILQDKEQTLGKIIMVIKVALGKMF